MYFHKEGRTIIATSTAISIILIVTTILLGDKNCPMIVAYSITGLAVLFTLFSLYFFRMPKREFVYNDKLIMSSCDGKVVGFKTDGKIQPFKIVEEPEYFQGKRMQISVFMSPLNVHVNRYPINGKVKYYRYHPGKYLVAFHPKCSELNERTTIVLEHENRKEILVRQIAGAVARRIVCYAKEGKAICQNSELGFIKFGSRVDFFLPLDTKILVSPEQIVKGGQTALAEW
jgi:phosphatidylserine decarboxylase